MAEIYPSDSDLLDLLSEFETGVEYIATGTAPYYLQFRKLLYRLLLSTRRANDFRIYDEGGAYYQTILDASFNGVNASAAVKFDFQNNAVNGFVFSANENIVLECIYIAGINNDATAKKYAVSFSVACDSLFVNHVFTSGGYYNYIGICCGLYIFDSLHFIETVSGGYAVTLAAGSIGFIDKMLVKVSNPLNITAEAFKPNMAYQAIMNCLQIGGGHGVSAPHGGYQYVSNCTFFNLHTSIVRVGGLTDKGVMAMRNCIGILAEDSDLAVEQYTIGGAFFGDHNCFYPNDGALVDFANAATNPADSAAKSGYNTIQVDPLLDGDYEPLEEQVRTGGSPDVLGDATSIGAIKTMNTTVINTAVQAALTSGGVKLAADGLDNVVVAEPSGDPSGWSFAQCVRWLIMRFFNKHTSDNFSGIVVHKSDGTVSTSQAVTEVEGVKSVSEVS